MSDAEEILPQFPAMRLVVNAEALAWLSAHQAVPGTSVITSLPDVSEISSLSFAQWQLWFIEAARQIIRWVPNDGVAIFFQSDIRHQNIWVDKSYLLLCAAEKESASLVWRKIVCRRPPGTIAPGRPSFSHMLCIARTPRPLARRPGPDVIADAGTMSWPRAMGELACRVACRYLREETNSHTVVDPFCGYGSVLEEANAQGFKAIGVDLSAKRCRIAYGQSRRDHR